MSSKSCQPVEGEELKARYATCADLLKSEAFSTRLRRCLGRFINLDTIGLAHHTTNYLLDPRQQKVRFLGWRHLINRIDFQFNHSGLGYLRGRRRNDINSLALSRPFQAFNESKRKQKIRKLRTCNADFCGGISPGSTVTQAQYNNLDAVGV
ncbi:hypothetical protein N7449_004708 [Penicillium cf. viridicatum]|uniref:Uncharacterized protein n=1 Tax=Penicillium cf. viridicatum TaxID=2972119 RepID=A0A9W9MJW4_9EURO|nr:hypothetical protein N7449_004708 [Penicillium cf. viridicatum]